MDTKIIDGKKLAAEHKEGLRLKIGELNIKPNVVSILVGDDPASVLYSNLKQQKAQSLGINFELKRFPSDTDFNLIVDEISKLNKDPNITGIMIQLPLPKEFLQEHQSEDLIQMINPLKDIDGLTGKGKFLSATARGVLSILDSLKVDYQKNVFAVVGSEGQVGKEVVKELEIKGVKVIKVDKKLPNSKLEDLKEADLIISCTGVNSLIKEEDVKDGSLLIDVGLGDFDPKAYEKASKYTPIKGGVGPMTVISLMENVVEAVYNFEHSEK